MPPRPQPAIARLMAKVAATPEAGCWIFTGATTRGGYGNLLGSAPGTRVYAHRLAYEHFVGPIPDGCQLDHLCQTPACVNPAHLEPVTEAENHRRTAERRVTCPQGHPYTPENTYHRPDGRICRTCRLAQVAAYKRRRRQQRSAA